jgi:transcriptional accessory protein Tex/SPT6
VESAVEAASETPATEATSDASAADAPAAEAEGASYTPVAEDESGKPRRVKDLEPGMELEGRVTSIALYGIFVDIGVGRDGLVHISEMSDTRIDSPSDVVQIGDTVKVRVKSVEPDGRRISLTMRSKERGNQPRERARKKPELNREALSELRVGDNIEGTVTGIAPFGVFVDIGVGKDGLVHVSELAEGRIEKAEDAVTVGQTYTFKVLEVDADGTRISLSLRRAQRGQRLAQLEKGQIVEGTISGLAPFGAFVDIGVGRDGLVHISELSDQRVAKVEDAVKVGDTVKVRVLDIDSGSKRISLSMRLEDRPREQPAPSEPREPREPREDRPRRDDRAPRGPRRERDEAPRAPEVYSSTEEPEESFSGDATIEDLLSKFGNVNKRDRKRRADEDEEDYEERYSRRQRDAIRRTLQQMSDDE